MIGVCSLDAIGSGARTVVTDARRKEIYWADLRRGRRPDRRARPSSARRSSAARARSSGDPAFAERLGAEWRRPT